MLIDQQILQATLQQRMLAVKEKIHPSHCVYMQIEDRHQRKMILSALLWEYLWVVYFYWL